MNKRSCVSCGVGSSRGCAVASDQVFGDGARGKGLMDVAPDVLWVGAHGVSRPVPSMGSLFLCEVTRAGRKRLFRAGDQGVQSGRTPVAWEVDGGAQRDRGQILTRVRFCSSVDS